MPTRKASARWEGGLKSGKGTFKGESGAIQGQYSWTRFEEATEGTNPEELLAAAEASCFSMALSGNLEKNGTPPTSIETQAACTVGPVEGGFKVTKMHLVVSAAVPQIDDAKFQELVNKTLTGCPVSKALHGNVEMSAEARLTG